MLFIFTVRFSTFGLILILVGIQTDAEYQVLNVKTQHYCSCATKENTLQTSNHKMLFCFRVSCFVIQTITVYYLKACLTFGPLSIALDSVVIMLPVSSDSPGRSSSLLFNTRRLSKFKLRIMAQNAIIFHCSISFLFGIRTDTDACRNSDRCPMSKLNIIVPCNLEANIIFSFEVQPKKTHYKLPISKDHFVFDFRISIFVIQTDTVYRKPV